MDGTLAAALGSSRRRNALAGAAGVGIGGHMGRVRPLCSVVEGRAEKTKASSSSAAAAGAVAAGAGGQSVNPASIMAAAMGRTTAAAASAGADDGDDEGKQQQAGGDGGQEEGSAEEGSAKDGVGGGGGGAPDLTGESKRLEELEAEIWRMAGREFKITSYVELSRVLFEDLKLPVVKQPTNKVLGGVSDRIGMGMGMVAYHDCGLHSTHISCQHTVLLHEQRRAERAVGHGCVRTLHTYITFQATRPHPPISSSTATKISRTEPKQNKTKHTPGFELPAKVLDYRALLYLIRSKQGKKKKAAGEGKSAKAAAEALAAEKGLGKGERMSPEEKLMMSMLKEESGVDALDRTMERVGVDIEKVMERVQTMTTGGGLRTPGGATGEAAVEDFVPEEGGFEEPDLTEPLPVLQEEAAAGEDGDLPASLFDKGWGVANNFVLVDANSIIFRTYHAMPKLTTAAGAPINAVLGLCNVLNRLLLPAMTQSRVRPYVLVVFDGHKPLHRQTVRGVAWRGVAWCLCCEPAMK